MALYKSIIIIVIIIIIIIIVSEPICYHDAWFPAWTGGMRRQR